MKRKSPSSERSEESNVDKKARVEKKDPADDAKLHEAKGPLNGEKKILYTEKKIWPKKVQEFIDHKDQLTTFLVGSDRVKLYGNPTTMSLKSLVIAEEMKHLLGTEPPFILFPDMKMNCAPLLVVWLVINGVSIVLEETDEDYEDTHESMLHNLTA